MFVSSKITLLICLLLFWVVSFSQFAENIRTGRPGQAIGPYSVGKNIIQTQLGFDFGGAKISEYEISKSFINPNNVLRFGLTKKIEINSGIAYQAEETKVASLFSSKKSGLSLVSIGTRVNILNSENYIPSIGFQFTIKLPIISNAYNFDKIAPKFILIVSQKVAKKLGITINTGLNYNGNDSIPRGFYVININYSMNQKIGIFAESYADFGNGFSNFYWDAGISHLINSNLQFDYYCGFAQNVNTFSYFGSVGLSWRFVKWHAS